jgi:hypothetical protein
MRFLGTIWRLTSKNYILIKVNLYVEGEFEKYRKVLTQERNAKDKIYSLHEPQTTCIAKGKAHKAYVFETKVAVVRDRDTGVITAVKNDFMEIHMIVKP